MVLEQVPGVADAPAPTPPAPQAEPVPEPEPVEAEAEEQGEVEPEGEEAPPVTTFRDTIEEWRADEARKAEIEEWESELRRDQQSKTQKQLQPLYEKAAQTAQQYQETAQTAVNYGAAVLQKLNAIEKAGIAEEGEIGQVLAQHLGPFAQLMGGLTQRAGEHMGRDWMIAILSDHAGTEADSYRQRLRASESTGDSPEVKVLIVKEWFDTAVAEREKKAEEKGYRRGLKESGKAVARKGAAEANASAGPDTAKGGSGGFGKPYAQLTSEQRQQLQKEDRVDAYIQKYG